MVPSRSSNANSHPDRTRLRTCRGLRSGISLASAILLGSGVPAGAQTLNEVVTRALISDCDGLAGSTGGNPGAYGPNLGAICTIAQNHQTGSSNGGGAGSSPQTLSLSLEDRRETHSEEQADGSSVEIFEGISLFGSAKYEALSRNVTTFADGFDSDVETAMIGLDRRFGEHALAGIAFGYARTDGDWDAGGDFGTSAYQGTLYGSFFPRPEIFVDVAAHYARSDFKIDRTTTFVEFDADAQDENIFTGDLHSDTHGDEVGGSLVLGTDVSVENVSFGPRVGVDYVYRRVGGYTETRGGGAVPNGGGAAGLALRYDDESTDSLRSTVGFQGSMALSTPIGAVIPQLDFTWFHEFLNHQRRIEVAFAEDLRPVPDELSFQTERPVRNFFEVGGGLSVVLANGFQPFTHVSAMIGNDDYDNVAVIAGLRVDR